MSNTLATAREHLAKAREFLESAERDMTEARPTAATSSAVLAGINAKDAICLRLKKRTGKTDDHKAAIAELAAAGPAGKALESTFSRLIAKKTASQYTAGPVSPANATKAVEWATRMVDGAAAVVTS